MSTKVHTVPIGNPKTAVAYMRCSTDQQDLSPFAQRDAIERWAQAHSIEVVAWHLDKGVSGAKSLADRPGLIAALTDIGLTKAGHLVVAKRDRLARDTLVALLIEQAAKQKGAAITSADDVGNGDDPGSEMLRQILFAVAAYERQMIRARVKGAMQVKRKRGERLGQIPFGYMLAEDKITLIACEHEQQLIRLVNELRGQENSFGRIASELNRRGYVARNGKPFEAMQVYRMVIKDEAAAA